MLPIGYSPMSAISEIKFRLIAGNKGVTIIELMVAMAISLVVLLAVGTVYSNIRRTYNVQDGFARMQESALFAFQRLTQDISASGFAGCTPQVNSLLNTTNADAELYDFLDGIYGWEYTGNGGTDTSPGNPYTITALTAGAAGATNWKDNAGQGLLASLAALAIPGSDVLVIKAATEQSNQSPTANVTPGNPITFAKQTNMDQGSVMIVSDCNKADLFMNSDTSTSLTLNNASNCGSALPCNNGSPWSHTYYLANTSSITAGFRVFSTTSRAYFIGSAPNGEPALFYIDYDAGETLKSGAAPQPQELVEGVENMQILYGVNLGGTPLTPTQYVTYNKIATADMSKIVSVRISLLMRSTTDLNRPSNNLNPCTAATSTCLVGGVDNATAVTVTPLPAKRLYKVFSSTIALRNMQIDGR